MRETRQYPSMLIFCDELDSHLNMCVFSRTHIKFFMKKVTVNRIDYDIDYELESSDGGKTWRRGSWYHPIWRSGVPTYEDSGNPTHKASKIISDALEAEAKRKMEFPDENVQYLIHQADYRSNFNERQHLLDNIEGAEEDVAKAKAKLKELKKEHAALLKEAKKNINKDVWDDDEGLVTKAAVWHCPRCKSTDTLEAVDGFKGTDQRAYYAITNVNMETGDYTVEWEPTETQEVDPDDGDTLNAMNVLHISCSSCGHYWDGADPKAEFEADCKRSKEFEEVPA